MRTTKGNSGLVRLALPTLFTLGLLACRTGAREPSPAGAQGNPAPAQPSQSTSDARGDSLRAIVRGEVGEPSCKDVSQCRTVAFGKKPCGGPRSYLVYSIATTDSMRLAEAVTQFNDWDRARNRELGLRSDCAFVSAPPVVCATGRCEAAEQ